MQHGKSKGCPPDRWPRALRPNFPLLPPSLTLSPSRVPLLFPQCRRHGALAMGLPVSLFPVPIHTATSPGPASLLRYCLPLPCPFCFQLPPETQTHPAPSVPPISFSLPPAPDSQTHIHTTTLPPRGPEA